jgi:hypothetical protein
MFLISSWHFPISKGGSMNRSRRIKWVIFLLSIVLTGCGALIFNADFDGWPAGSPAGPPPGAPNDDQIIVQNSNNPVVSSSLLIFHPSPNTFFFSRSIQDPDATKTIFWKGHLTSGDGPFTVLVSAANSPGSIFLTNPIDLRFTNNEVKMIDLPPGNNVLHTHSLTPNEPHEVFISLRLKSGTYSITIQQPSAPEISFTGNLNALTTNWIKTHTRIVMEAAFIPGAGATDEYKMDDVIMREK